MAGQLRKIRNAASATAARASRKITPIAPNNHGAGPPAAGGGSGVTLGPVDSSSITVPMVAAPFRTDLTDQSPSCPDRRPDVADHSAIASPIGVDGPAFTNGHSSSAIRRQFAVLSN